jgi:YidC/Oxa1 family membrane protein insertase
MFDFLAGGLAATYDLWPSYAGSIALLTLAIMLVLSPLSIKATRSMIKMQRLQPEMKRLQAQYKGDREALNREMMAFYQANNVNPFSSCLPLLLQMPVFFVLYQVLSGLTRTDGDGRFVPKYLDESSALFRALHGATEMNSFGIDLSRSALKAMNESGIGAAVPYFLMVGLVALTTWYQQRQVQGRNPSATVNPQQQMISKIIPFIMIPVTISIPAGVVVYFIVSNFVRVGQQGVISWLEFRDGGSHASPIVVPTPTTPPPNKAASSKPAQRSSGRVTPAKGSAAARNQSNQKRKRK